MRLNNLQRSFTDHLFDRIERIDNPDDEFAHVFASSKVPLTEQLSIYRTHVVKTLRSVIQSNFPLVEKLVGEEFMRTMATHYILDNPPQEACLNYYGDGFATFIPTYKAANNLPYLSDCARLDWAKNMSYYARNDKALRLQDLATIDPERYGDVIFELSDHVKLLSSEYPLSAIYKHSTNDGDQELNIDNSPEWLAIVRIGDDSEIMKLSVAEHKLLSEIQSGAPLGLALESAFALHPEFDFDAFLQNMMAVKAFTSYRYSKELR